MQVKAKKGLGQHFLTDLAIAQKIVDAMDGEPTGKVLEIGPGMGVLTRILLKNRSYETTVVEIDHESVDYLHRHFPELSGRILSNDFLQMDFGREYTTSPFSIIGNMPYNISSQIFFNLIENRNQIPLVVCMLQKEVAERICSAPGSKVYGILSVLLQAWYKIEYLFTVDEYVFNPPPKVKSAVIRLKRNDVMELGCNEKLFKTIVKLAFNQRRKMLRNSIKSITEKINELDAFLMTRRPEQLSVKDFVSLTNTIELLNKHS